MFFLLFPNRPGKVSWGCRQSSLQGSQRTGPQEGGTGCSDRGPHFPCPGSTADLFKSRYMSPFTGAVMLSQTLPTLRQRPRVTCC